MRASKRYLVICVHHADASDAIVTICLAVGPWILGVSLNIIARMLPCCGLQLRYDLYSAHSWRPPDKPSAVNYSDLYVGLPCCVATTTIIVVCYVKVSCKCMVCKY
ncbi:unnamed protein product [Anisakis simplex]|uniref:G_PROTEIN_RECEP_F1_2 domain-containing protein n=1 Tax=Anisakis simplex TaxID=6269 RepID=A0A0M3KJD4_ANISI|nr:unnamed protein product [Anisakis simplex]